MIAEAQRTAIGQQCNNLAKAGTEHAHQRAFFAWLAWMKHTGEYPRADRCFAIPNGGKRDPITAARLKAEGVKAGVPDTFYPVPIFMNWELGRDWQVVKFAGLWLEFKKPGKGKESDKQTDWIAQALSDGYAACTVYTWQGAAAAFEDYNAGRPVRREYL